MVWIPYCGAAPVPADLLWRWNLDPALLAIIGALFIGSLIAPARSTRGERRWTAPLAVFVAFLLFVSPLCALTSALFSARAAHHIALVAILAPLVAMAAARQWRAIRLATIYAAPAVFAAVFWLWHVPGLYAWALSSDAGYWIMQLSLLASATALVGAVGAAAPPLAAALLLATMMQMGLLGAILSFAPEPAYPPHFATTLAWGLSPLADQQLAGAAMWTLGSLPFLLAALLAMHRVLAPAGGGGRC